MRTTSLPLPTLRQLAFLLLPLWAAWGCSEAEVARVKGLPAAFGKANKLAVVADSSWWSRGLGDSVDFRFGAPFLLLPAPEPMYDLTHFTWKDLEAKPLRRELRAYLLVSHAGLQGTALDDFMREDLGDSVLAGGKPYTVKLVRNRWARGQLLIYLYGSDAQAVYRALAEGSEEMLAKLREHDRPILRSQTYARKPNAELSKQVKDHVGAAFSIPGEYLPGMEADSTLWLRMELEDASVGLLFRKVPYTGQDQFATEGFRALHDRMTAVVSSAQPDPSRMLVDDRHLPLFRSVTTLDGQYALETRGLWRMEGDVMGGPFLSYMIQTPDRRSIILATGFVYGPGLLHKREVMQQIEIILRRVRFDR